MLLSVTSSTSTKDDPARAEVSVPALLASVWGMVCVVCVLWVVLELCVVCICVRGACCVCRVGGVRGTWEALDVSYSRI